MQSVYVVAAARTPIGSFQGSLAELTGPRLGAAAIAAALERSKLRAELIEHVWMGNVLQAGEGQAPARQAALYGGLPQQVPCVTVNKVCGSSLEALILGTRQIALGDADIVIAGGFESMSNVPYYLPKARAGMRMGNGEVIDGMIHDGLWDPYGGVHMGNCGDLCAQEFAFSREAQDEFAAESYRRALHAQKEGLFASEITPVSIPQKKGDAVVVSDDEEPKRGNPAKMASLRPAFGKNGSVTAANASKIDDGGAALVLASEKAVREHDLTPIARVAGYAGVAQKPEWFTTAPAYAIEKLLAKQRLRADDVGLWEINEAFSVVTMHSIRQCNLDPARVNVRGGAVALGHPIGATGARLAVTLLHAMRDRGEKLGVASLCIGGGEALAVSFEAA